MSSSSPGGWSDTSIASGRGELIERLEQELAVLKIANQRLDKLIEEKIRDPRRQRILSLKKYKEVLVKDVMNVRLLLEETRRDYENVSFGLATEVASQMRLESYQEAAFRDLSTASMSMWTKNHEIRALTDTFTLKESQLHDRNTSLLAQLNELLPLGYTADQSGFRVASIVVPRHGDLNTLKPEALAYVLGTVVHVLVLISTWFDIVFPNQLRYRSSRSVIFSSGDSDLSRPLCLWQGVDNAGTFESALRLLQKNVVFLEGSLGHKITKEERHCLLPNLWTSLRLLRKQRTSR